MGGDRRTALVTGGAGFIGSHLCEHLLADLDRILRDVTAAPAAADEDARTADARAM